MEYKIGQVLDTVPESVFNKSGRKEPIFEKEKYAETLTAHPNKWVVLEIIDDRKATKLHTRETRYNKKYNSKGFEFRRIVTPTNQLFMGRYNPSLLS
jgi:hypothetical protein